MNIDKRQCLAGEETSILRTLPHSNIDVALIELDRDIPTTRGLAFRPPIVAEAVFTLGYPRVPMTRSPTLIMQSGEVTSQTETLISGQTVFLYSATARPGNSGGPIISKSGHVVGIVTQQLEEQRDCASVFPFHAGIDALSIQRAIEELAPSVELPLENYE
jgi:S1-C subfamily serine protease